MKINIRGMNYYYSIDGEGEPLLLLHGFTGSSETWRPFIKKWATSFRVITVDLPGHGQTDSPQDVTRYTTESTVLDINILLNSLNVDRVNLLGYSMGGRLALSFTMMHPNRVKTLIMESSSPGLSSANEREHRISNDQKLANCIMEKGILNFVNYWEDIPLFFSQKSLPTEIQMKIRNERLQQNQTGLANSLRGLGTGIQPSWWEQLENVHIPTWLIVGSNDEKFTRIAEKMVDNLQNARILIIPDAGHAIHVEKPDKFGKIILNVLLQQIKEDT